MISGKFRKRLRFYDQLNKNNASTYPYRTAGVLERGIQTRGQFRSDSSGAGGRGDRIEVEKIANRTLDLFQRTLKIAEERLDDRTTSDGESLEPNRFVPEHGDLRQRFLFAETLGSYSALQDLLDAYSPAYRLYREYDKKARKRRLNTFEVRALEQYRDQIDSAIVHANDYLLSNASATYTSDEL